MKKELFSKELDKILKKTHDTHVAFNVSNKKMKSIFQQNFNKKTLGCVYEVVDKIGYDVEKDGVKAFLDKVDSGNYDDNDVEMFKARIEPYIDQIMKKLREAGDFDD